MPIIINFCFIIISTFLMEKSKESKKSMEEELKEDRIKLLDDIYEATLEAGGDLENFNNNGPKVVQKVMDNLRKKGRLNLRDAY